MKCMKRIRQTLSICIAFSLLISMTLPTPIGALAADDPWEDGAEWPDLQGVSRLKTGQQYFTYKEWTGEVDNKDGQNQPVRQSDVFEVNAEKAHGSDTLPYDSVEHARKGAADYDLALSPYYQPLTGKGQPWDMTVYRSPADADAAGVSSSFYKTDYTGVRDDPYMGRGIVSDYENADYGCGWKSVTLPASWQTQGFDFPIYANIDTPWSNVYGNAEAVQPLAPTVTNPTGFYRRSFDVDLTWLQNGGKVYISFQGVESSMYLYINGNEVGYTEDSFDAHDFDITPFLHADGKDNLLAVRVQRWCDGSWLEDQDKIRLAGIFRDVYLYATPAVDIRDYKVETDLDSDFMNAGLKLDIAVRNQSASGISDYGVDVKLFDADGNDLFSTAPLRSDLPAVASGGESVLTLNRTIRDPRLWSDEDPYLYTLVISLYDKTSKKLFESVGQQLGFREIGFTKTEVDGAYNKTTTFYQNITINGNPLFFRGVNRSDIDELTGKYVSKELYEKDVRMMKRNNINALRTSHYPNDRYLYYLCDKYGVFLMAETNMECHALSGESDSMAANFTGVYHDRLTANMEAQKNRTSVVMWSLGNESGDTPNSKMFQKAIQNVARPIDSTRPIHFQSLYDSGGVDVASTMYSSVGDVRSRSDRSDNMPYLQCEYDHAMGNAVGNLQEYMEAYRSRPNILGGFIWDWVDQTIATPLPSVFKVEADQSGNDFTGLLKGTVDDDPQWGKIMTGYMTFPSGSNAANDKLNTALSGRNAFSLELQVKPKKAGNLHSLITKGDHQVALRTRDGDLDFYVYAGNKWVQNSFSLPSNWDGNWHQVVAVFDGTHLRAYCDGAALPLSRADSTVNADINKSDMDLAINYEVENPGRIGNNRVAKVRIYGKALSQAEMTAQNEGDRGTGTYAITKDSPEVLLWEDLSKAVTTANPDSVWDYFASIGKTDLSGKYEAYGGDWGDVINSGCFSGDGLMSADRTAQPELAEVKFQYQPISFTADLNGILERRVSITNRMSFLGTDAYTLEWDLVEDGKVIDSGTIGDVAGPRQTKTVTVPFAMPQHLKADGEYFLNLYAKVETDACLYAEKGYAIAYGQIRVPATVSKVPPVDTSGIPEIVETESGNTVSFAGPDFKLDFDRTTGRITDYTYYGQTMMTAGPVANYWRAPADNDVGVDGKWQNANEGMTVTNFDVMPAQDNKTVTVMVKLNLPNAGGSNQTMRYTLYGSGEIAVKADFIPASGLGEMLRYGAELELPRGFENIVWYGAGPQETYRDRKQGSPIGVYRTTVTDSFFPYIRPQTAGNHVDVRYIALEDPAKPAGLMVVSGDQMEAGALHFSTAELSGKGHPYQLPRTDHTVLNIDCKSRGLGAASCGPQPLAQYRMPGDTGYSYFYTIVPYEKGATDLMELSKVYRDASSFNKGSYDEQEAERVDGLIDRVSRLFTYGQKPDIEAARAAYEALSTEQKALVKNLSVLKDAENKIESLKNVRAFVKDEGSHKLDAEITDTAVVAKDASSPTGYSMRGYYTVPDKGLINQAIAGTKPFSMEVWVNPSDLDDYNVFLAKGDTQASVQAKGGGIEFFIRDSGGWYSLNPIPAGWSANVWHHIVGTYDGSSLKLYLDGDLIGENTVNKSVATNGYDFGVGICTENASRKLRGKIGAARVYSRALSPDDVKLRYRADKKESVTAIGPDDEDVLFWYDLSGIYTVGQTPDSPGSSSGGSASGPASGSSRPSSSDKSVSSAPGDSGPASASARNPSVSGAGSETSNPPTGRTQPGSLIFLLLSFAGVVLAAFLKRKKMSEKSV